MAKTELKVVKTKDAEGKVADALQKCLNGASAGNNKISAIIKTALVGGVEVTL